MLLKNLFRCVRRGARARKATRLRLPEKAFFTVVRLALSVPGSPPVSVFSVGSFRCVRRLGHLGRLRTGRPLRCRSWVLVPLRLLGALGGLWLPLRLSFVRCFHSSCGFFVRRFHQSDFSVCLRVLWGTPVTKKRTKTQTNFAKDVFCEVANFYQKERFYQKGTRDGGGK